MLMSFMKGKFKTFDCNLCKYKKQCVNSPEAMNIVNGDYCLNVAVAGSIVMYDRIIKNS